MSTKQPFEDSPEFAKAKRAFEERLERENQKSCANCAYSAPLPESGEGSLYQCQAPHPEWATHAASMTTWIGEGQTRAPPRTMNAGSGTKCQVFQKVPDAS